MEETELKIIKETIEEFLQKMTVVVFNIEVILSFINEKESVGVDVNVEEPQVLIGQNGQTLFELQRLLTIILNKKLQKGFYIDLDINDYKKQKIEYLKKMAMDLANKVALTKERKVLPPMPSYERKIIHSELSQRQDVVTESQGEGEARCVVINPTN